MVKGVTVARLGHATFLAPPPSVEAPPHSAKASSSVVDAPPPGAEAPSLGVEPLPPSGDASPPGGDALPSGVEAPPLCADLPSPGGDARDISQSRGELIDKVIFDKIPIGELCVLRDILCTSVFLRRRIFFGPNLTLTYPNLTYPNLT